MPRHANWIHGSFAGTGAPWRIAFGTAMTSQDRRLAGAGVVASTFRMNAWPTRPVLRGRDGGDLAEFLPQPRGEARTAPVGLVDSCGPAR